MSATLLLTSLRAAATAANTTSAGTLSPTKQTSSVRYTPRCAAM
jgi:hypothetical protein